MPQCLDQYKNVILSVCLLVYLGFGALTFRDFGMSYDEKEQRKYGHAAWSYVFENDDSLLTNRNKYHGPFFEMVLVGLEKALQLKDTRPIYHMRHLAGFLFFTFGLVFFYLLVKYYFKDWKWALLGALLMGLTPRILGEAFYNSKDVPFMVMFIISLYTHVLFMNKKTWPRLLLHGLMCGITIDIRVMGGLVVFFTIAQSAVEGFHGRKTWLVLKKLIVQTFTFLAVAALAALLFWPILWEGPLYHFAAALKEMSRFPWPGENVFLGKFMKGTNVPWYFTLVWMGVTIPVPYLLAFCLGIYPTVRHSLQEIRKPTGRHYLNTLWLIVFGLPLVLYAVLGSTLYGGWRHSYYLYPAFLMIALNGIRWAYELPCEKLPRYKQQVLQAGVGMLLLIAAGNVYWIARYHPYQYMFFNHSAGGLKGAKFKFQIDYWGGPFLNALEHILEKDTSGKVRVFVRHKTGRFTQEMVRTRDRERLIYVDRMEDADYFIGNYRFFNEEYRHENEVYAIHIANTKVMAVFKREKK